jgi:hypothetical protein
MQFLREHFKAKNVAHLDAASGWSLKIPKVFSFLNNPEETLNVIYSLVAISARKQMRALYIDYSECQELDLGASAAFDVVACGLRDEWRLYGGRYRLHGSYPNDRRVHGIMACTGITKQLGIAAPKEWEEQMVKFELFRGKKDQGSALHGRQDRDTAASKMAEYVDQCLRTAAGYGLSADGKRQILKWAGELITNAEEHSGLEEWYATGYMVPMLASGEHSAPSFLIGECRFVVFGFGRSIYQSLSSLPRHSQTRKNIQTLVQKHGKRRFLSTAPTPPEKNSWTLCALQDGISRFTHNPGENTRGKGTVEMIEAFQQLGKTIDTDNRPEMALVSGETRIWFNERYRLGLKNQRKIIAFNDANDLEQTPDPCHVHSLNGHFPGTLLTMRFFIDKRYLDSIHSQGKVK